VTDVCACGHDQGAHVFKAPLPAFANAASAPLWGWMVCPAEECECRETWSFDRMYSEAEVERLIAPWVDESGYPAH
jgi:hypothetical protein